MERIGTLIEKLQEQHAAGVDIDQLLLTAQLLEAELRYHRQVGATPVNGSVSALMPNRLRNGHAAQSATARSPLQDPPSPRSPEPTPVVKVLTPTPPDHERYMPRNGNGAPAPAAPQPAPPRYERAVPEPDEYEAQPFNPIQEVPTLSHQLPRDERRELNEIVGRTNGSSRNDLFRDQQRELSATLTEAPIRDLKKAIGINDRFVFITELFRGDETMYERSVKTINNFGAYQEAHYWMERELKLKLAWDTDKTITKLFYQLVRRRFS